MMTIKYSKVLVGLTMTVHLINSVGGFFFISSEQQPTMSAEFSDALGGSKNLTTMSMSSSMKAEQFVLERRLADIERRLSSVEQPVWKIVVSDFRAWNLCSSEGLCRCLPALKQINCFRLSLKSVPATQSIPNDINHIDLSSNHLSTLHKDTFRGLTHLTLLDLSRNRLDFLPSDLLVDLDSLANLRLQENRIESVDEQLFMKIRSLTILDFSHNNLLSSLPSELFRSIYHIKVINLSHNKLNKLPRLQEQTEMEELDVSRNKLSAIESDDLMQLKSLKILRLSENFIVKIASDAFDSLSMLQHLYLKKNFIMHIDERHFRNLRNLIILDLASNKIQTIHANAFYTLTKVSELYLSQNSLNQIPENLFIAMKSLKRLMLFSNDFRYLQAKSFVGLSSLTNLLLNNNNIKSFDAELFAPLVNLTKLRLDSNKLQHLPKNCLDKLGKLMKIKLDKNPWHCDCASIYLARFLREHHKKLWNGNGGVPICLGPGELGGKQVNMLRFDQLCYGQWHSMLSLRVPVKKEAFETKEPLTMFDKINKFRNITGQQKTASEKPDFEVVDEDSI